MKNVNRGVLLTVVLLVGLFVVACPERRTVRDIEANPSKYYDKEVTVVGIVRDSYGVSVPGTPIRGGAYKVDDGTGSIWVVTENTVPVKGTEIGVSGRVGSGVNWKGKNYGLGMYENDRKFKGR